MTPELPKSTDEWLEAMGLGEYRAAFAAQHIEPALLSSLGDQDLKDLGVASLGHRKKLLAGISALANAPAEPMRGAAEDGERRQLTVLFCDMVGFTELAARLDPEVLQQVVRAYEDTCAVCISRYDGFVFQRLGDGIVAFFGYPMAHEDEAARAIHAALAILESLAGLEVPAAGRLAVRIGIATGVVVVSATSRSAVGETMNLAARLQGLAPVGSIVVSEGVRQLAAGAFEFQGLGEQQLKGLPGSTLAHRVVGASSMPSRFEAATQQGLTPIVGREAELAMLRARWQRVCAGQGQVVLLSGEPGVGKSRAVNALLGELGDAGERAIRWQCSPYHSTSALHPCAAQLRRALGLQAEDAPDVQLDKLEAMLVHTHGRPASDAVYLASMLALPFENRYGRVQMGGTRFRSETLRCLVDLLQASAREAPGVLVFEDLQWSDPSSLDLLDLLVQRVPGFPLLVVLTCRPEFRPRWPDADHLGLLEMAKLSREQSRSLVLGLTQGKDLPGKLLEQIVTRTDGVPLYVEELTRSILESGELRDVGDRFETTGLARSVHIPASLRDSLMARLDRDARIKEIAQVGAVIGREFSEELVRAVAPMSPAELDLALARLLESGVATRRDEGSRRVFQFRHALVQDVAYDSLLKSRRKELHARIARCLEADASGGQGVEPELLAQHFGAAGLAREAVMHGLEAARRAGARSAFLEALALLDTGERWLLEMPASSERTQLQLRMQLQRAGALLATKAYSAPETGAAWAAARRLCDELGPDARETATALFGHALFQFTCGDMREAEATARELLQRAKQADEGALLLMAHRMLGTLHFYRGAFGDAATHLALAVQVYDPERDRDSAALMGADQKASSLAYLALVQHITGQAEKARVTSDAAVAHAHALGHQLGIAGIGWFAVHLAIHRREPERALREATALMALSEQHGFPVWYGIAQLGRGVAHTQLGEPVRGRESIRAWLDRSHEMGYRAIRSWSMACAAQAEAAALDWDAAWAWLEEAASEVEATDERWYEAEIHRLRGTVLLARQGREAAPAAERCFERALELSEQQGAVFWALRAAVSLARLWHGQGKADKADKAEKARHLLALHIHRFDPGVELPDLQEARALCAELGP